jgi:hypothetical protein
MKKGTKKVTASAVKAAHGEVTGKASFSTIRQKLQDALELDGRFPTYTPLANPGDTVPYSYAPYVVDILAPDDDGTMQAVVCAYDDNDGDGDVDMKYYRVNFSWDGDKGQVSLGGDEPQLTEPTTVYSKLASENLKSIKAAWSDAAREASAESRRKAHEMSQEELKTEISKHLKENGTKRLGELRKHFGASKVDQSNPLANPVHKALASMRDSGHVSVHGGDWGEPSFSHKSDYTTASTGIDSRDIIHCHAVGAALSADKWSVDEPVTFQWMPGGVSTIEAGWAGRCVRMTVECDEDAASAVQASLDQLLGERQKPYGCVEHREEEAALWPESFAWKDDPEPGVYCTAKPSELGAKNVNGRVHRSWSPSFITDADFSKVTCTECRKKVSGCECDGGTVAFPEGARGSKSNPARITGVAPTSVGSLTNKPAFRNILPVRAKQVDPQPAIKPNAEPKKGQMMKVKFVKARGQYTAGQEVELQADDPAILEGDAMSPVVANRIIAAEQARKTADIAKIDAALDRAVLRGALLPAGETAESMPKVRAKHMAKFEALTIDADSIVELLDYMPAKKDAAILEARNLGRVTDEGGQQQIGGRFELINASFRDQIGNGYIKAREPMNHLIRHGKLKEATDLSIETGAVLKAALSRLKGDEDFKLTDVVKAAGLDVADPDTQVGTLATGLVIMRNLGYLKSKLGWMGYISTDLRNEPVQFGQTVRTRYIVPPALLTYIPGVGYTRDSTTISNASATTAQDAVTTQTSGTRTTSMGATSTKGDTGTANAVDVDVKMDQHKGVEIEFSTQKLAGTMRNLFAEQQGAQFYSLAEGINLFFLSKLAAATWTGTVTSFSLGTFALPGMIRLKNRMTLNRLPDVGRFALIHSYFYDSVLQDTNLLLSKAIISLIKGNIDVMEQSDVPPLYGIKLLESQLATYAGGTYTAPTIAADGTSVTFGGGQNFVGIAGNSATALFVARVPSDYTKALPDIPATAAMEIVTEPDSGLSVLFCKYVDHIQARVAARCALMYGAAQGDPRQGVPLAP